MTAPVPSPPTLAQIAALTAELKRQCYAKLDTEVERDAAIERAEKAEARIAAAEEVLADGKFLYGVGGIWVRRDCVRAALATQPVADPGVRDGLFLRAERAEAALDRVRKPDGCRAGRDPMTLPPATTPGLTYWRCPECRRVAGLSFWDARRLFGDSLIDWRWSEAPRPLLYALENSVEAHEAEHMTVTG